MSKTLIANWKMNLSLKEAVKYIEVMKPISSKAKSEIIIAAPFTFLSGLKSVIKSAKLGLAAQNVAAEKAGAFTGEISASMIAEAGCDSCLVGHSERRIYFQETDDAVNKKIKILQEQKIAPVLCVGETDVERQKGLTQEVIKRQLKVGLNEITNVAKLSVAYEPVWAISTFQQSALKQTATIDQIEEAHLMIKKELVDLYGEKGKKIKILYGGSVSPQNCDMIFKSKFVDGALVGGASLKVLDFIAIINAVK